MKPTAIVLSATLVAALAVAGCGGPITPAPSPDLTAPRTPTAAAPVDAAPASIDVPSIGAHSTLDPLSVDPKTHEVIPPDVHHPQQAGWITVANPGAPLTNDPLVVLGHVDGDKQPGVFFRLRDIRAGAKIDLVMRDGTHRVYTVTRTQQIHKTQFPTRDVYGPAPDVQIRLVTCGGQFNPAARSYIDSVIAYGSLDN